MRTLASSFVPYKQAHGAELTLHVYPHTPPTLFLLGTKDPLIPLKTAVAFQARLEALGGRCDLQLLEGAGHPIYSYRQGDFPYRRETLAAADAFLASLGFLPKAANPGLSDRFAPDRTP